MEEKLILSENKVLEHNEKALKDTLQLLSETKDGDIGRLIQRAEADPRLREMISDIHLEKGRTVWLELNVKDSYLSSLIFSWMYSKSEHDGTSGLLALGCSLQTLMYSKPSNYDESEKAAIKALYDKTFGQ